MACKQLSYQQWRRPSLRPGLTHVGVVIVLCNLVILLSACSTVFSKPSQSGGTPASTTNSTPTPVISPTAKYVPPTITLQVIGSCPSLNWDSLVGTHANVNRVQKVICGSLEGPGTLQALIDVRSYSPDTRLDFYVYDNLYGTPIRRFGVQGLLNGDAVISPTGTIMTAETGPLDAFKAALDLYKEYQWNGATFVQILFPGIYPDMTHYQAEQDQARLNAEVAAGKSSNTWKNFSFSIAGNMAQKFFHWSQVKVSAIKVSQVYGTYIIAVTNLGPGGGGFVATLFRLDNILTNILEVKQITPFDGNVLLNSPTTGMQLTSPVSVSGSTITGGSILGRVVVFNDTLLTVGDSGDIQSSTSGGYVNFTRSINYHLNSTGVQEGAIAFYSTNQNNTSLSNQVVMVKVFLVG
jgi:hypothetical protein